MILIFSIAMDADSPFYVKFIATYAPTCIVWVYYFSLSHGVIFNSKSEAVIIQTPNDYLETLKELLIINLPISQSHHDI